MNWKSPYLLLVIATMFWGGNFVMGKGFANTIPPFTLAFFRWVSAFLFLAPFAWKEFSSNKQLWKKEWKILFWLALTGIAGFNTLVYIAVHYTTSINAALVNAPTPVLIMLLSFLFLKEKLEIRHVIGIIFSVVGVSWIVSHGSIEALLSFSINKGELWMLLAVTSWAVYSVIVKKNAHKFPASGVFLATIIIGICILIPFAAYEWITNAPIVFSAKGILGFLYLGACASVISFVCWNKAVIAIGPGKAAPFLNLIPIFASLFAITFLNESVTASQIIGGTIAITGVFITTGVFAKKAVNVGKQANKSE